jgi:hypothetical protein
MRKRCLVHQSHPILAVSMAALLLLTACDGTSQQQPSPAVMPTASMPYAAPIGDASLEYAGESTFYLPRFDFSHLVSYTDMAAFSASRLDAESVIRSLLIQPGNGVMAPLGGEVNLALFGANPVEVSGDVATVNLSASALQLDRATLYLCGQAIANTLTEMKNIRYVNLLVMDKQIGLDLGSTLPTGALTRSLSGDISAQYEQALSQRVQPGEDPTGSRLAATAALYFALSGTNGVISEARNISFTSQRMQDITVQLIDELGKGPVSGIESPPMPLLADLMTELPEITDGQDGSRIVTLRFDASLDDMLEAAGVSRASCFASLTYTLCTFLPNISGILSYIGDERVDHVMLGATDGILFEDGVQRRAHYAQLLMENATLYFADADGAHLTAVKRPVPFLQVQNPRMLLQMLFQGPLQADRPSDTLPLFSVNTLTDADIIGLSLNDGTLIVNLSDAFREAGKTLTAQGERLLAYGMVNTLLSNNRAGKICFFIGGKPFEGFTGSIDWGGYFYENRGLASED